MKGLDFFESVNNSLQKDALIELEKELGIQFPPLYFNFFATFKVGKNALNFGNFFHPKWNNISSSGTITFPQKKIDRSIWVNEFHDAPYIQRLRENDIEDDVLQENDLIRIGCIGIGGGLCLGLKNELKDKICVWIWDDEEPFVVLSNNILEFISKLEFIEGDLNLPEGAIHGKFYKKWEENFWRLNGN